MALNPSIILSGQGPQPINALAQGMEVGQRYNDIKQTNAMRDMYKQHGAGIASGDQNAMNALAAFDPQAALGVQGQRLGMDQTRQSMAHANANQARLSRQEQRAIEAQAAQMSAAERAAEAQRIEQSVAAGLQAQTPEQWDAMMQNAAPDLVGQFDSREMLAARFMSVADSLKRFDTMNAPGEGATPNSAIGKLQADLAAGLIDESQYEVALANMAPKGMRIASDGQGGFTMEQGAGVTGGNGKDLTVDAAKNTGFLIRAQESGAVLDALEDEGTSLGARVRGAVPFGLGNYMQSDEYQQFDQARRDFINAVLRRESGAVIADSEFANAEVQYFPQPGDSAAVIAQKRRNRENAIAGMAVGAGDGVNRIDEPRAPEIATQAPTTDMSDDDLLNFYLQGN